MFTTVGALKKAIEGDGRRRILSSTNNNRSLVRLTTPTAPIMYDGVFTLYRAYASLSQSQSQIATGTFSSSSSKKKKKDDSLKNIPLSAVVSGPTSTSITITTQSGHNNFLFQQPGRGFSSYHISHNKLQRFHPLVMVDGSRALLSTSSSSSTSTHAKIPTPKSSPTLSTSSNPLASIDPKAILKKTTDLTWYATKTVSKFIIRLPGNTYFFITHPKERREKITGIKEAVKKEIDHYWVGSKLLLADVKTARNLLGKTLQGSTLTRRERKQLLRTVSDLFRLVPFSMFLLIPFMEFALPFALRIFPNMLPSTFQESLKIEENMKRELKSRIAMAEFFQETMEELAHEQKRIAANRKDGKDEPADSIASKQEASASDMLKFLDLARKGEMAPPDAIIQYANYFQDDLTLDNMPRMQLINMCKYMSIPPYGSDSFLRFQLRHKIRLLKEDDQRILWEGIDSLTKMELREACQERGMRSTGMSKEAYKRSLQQWLDLSVNKDVPISLLIMSRTFFLHKEMTSAATADATDETQSVTGLADAISGMDKEVLNEVILQVATSEEFKSDPDVRKIQLEVITHQNEKIKEEQAERDAKKKKDSSEKEESQPVDQETDNKEPVDIMTGLNSKEGKITKEEILDAIDVKVEELKDDLLEKAAEIEMGERELTPEEMESISQLLSADPVVKERKSLDRIKQAMREESESESETGEPESGKTTVSNTETNVNMDESDMTAASIIEEMETKAAKEADELTSFSKEYETHSTTSINNNLTPEDEDNSAVDNTNDEPEDPVLAKLKKRIASMVDKIEVQLSDVQVKIGDKLHYLDKDMDGILSREEMAGVLSQVLKNISFEDALVIADEMDENKDGTFTVEELTKWIETNQLVKFESEGRDAEMDKIMESQTNEKEDAIAKGLDGDQK